MQTQPKRPKRPRDPAQLAKLIVDIGTGEVPNDKDDILNPPEPAGNARGAHARAEALTPERRREIAQRAAAARWGRT
ncbi:MAG: hypothetical protein OXQ31_09580 [Spirochaetaceae bacterium]|nr:hypothetical protein [Spirochaetaceae bacterium]